MTTPREEEEVEIEVSTTEREKMNENVINEKMNVIDINNDNEPASTTENNTTTTTNSPPKHRMRPMKNSNLYHQKQSKHTFDQEVIHFCR